MYLKTKEHIIHNQNIKTMKTIILTLATISTLALGIGTRSYAAVSPDSHRDAAKSQVSTVLNNVSSINKIEVRGNVEVYVSNSESDEVKVYNNYYAESALVQSQNGVLRISSYADQKLVVWIKAADLRAISAYDNAEVKSFGKISPIELDVNLHDNASAQLDMDAYSANVTLNGHATADLSGTASEVSVKRDVATSVNKFNLKAGRLTETRNVPAGSKEMDMATL
jgi:hypothetical protein